MKRLINIRNLDLLGRRLPVLLFIIVSFLILELSYIKVPGLHCEETFNAILTISLLRQLEQNTPLRDIVFPVREGWYHGALMAYLTLPFFYIMDIGVVPLRLMQICFVATSLILIYYFLYKFFNKYAAFISVFLLIINPAFIMETKIGNEATILLQFFTMLILLLLFYWYENQKYIYLYIAIFCMGLGLSTRLWFIWFIIALFITFLLFNTSIRKKLRFNFIKSGILGLPIFLLGGFLIIYSCISNDFYLIRFAAKHFFSPFTEPNYNNLDYFHNLIVNIQKFNSCISGSFSFIRQFGILYDNKFYIWTFWVSYFWLITRLFNKQSFFRKKRILFILLIFSLMMIQTPIVFSRRPHIHFMFFYPFVQIIIALAFIDIFYFFKDRRLTKTITRMILIVLLLLLSFKEMTGIYNYFSLMRKTGGVDEFSDAIYQLNDFLRQEEITVPVVCSWGLHGILEVTSKGTNNSSNAFYHLENDYPEYLKNEIRKGRRFYVFLPPNLPERKKALYLFKEIIKNERKKAVEVKRFYQRNGAPVYLVYSILET